MYLTTDPDQSEYLVIGYCIEADKIEYLIRNSFSGTKYAYEQEISDVKFIK